MSNTCPNCSAVVDADAVFCMSCGKSVSPTIHCPKCNGTINADAKFCKYCAFDLSQPIQSTTNATSATFDSDSNLQNTPQEETQIAPDNPASFISPSGAAIALICFFMPWIDVSCNAFGSKVAGKSASGGDLARLDESLWLLPLLAIGIIGAFFVFKTQRKTWQARPFIAICAGLALVFMTYKDVNLGVDYKQGWDFTIGSEWNTGVYFQPRFGIFGVVLGFIGALIGCAFMSRKVVNASSNQNSSLPNNFQSTNDSLKSNTAAMLCYIVPLVLPLAIFILDTLFFLRIGAVLFIILVIPSLFLVQVIFLNKKPYRDTVFVRFYAYQSLIFICLNIFVSLLLYLMIGSFRSDYAIKTYVPITEAIFWGLLISYVGLSIFCILKANNNEKFKIPIIGDWAMKLANKNIKYPPT